MHGYLNKSVTTYTLCLKGGWYQMANMQIVPACKNVEAQYVELMVPLYSHGCERKVKKTLTHLKGN